jgi:selenium-binding protein 1
VVKLDGEDYYLAGAPDAPGGAFDVPGHYWVLAGKNKLVGKHYNTGPFGLANGWSSDAGDGELLYIVQGIIDEWTEEKAEKYASRGYVHYHEFIRVSDGELHPTLVIWLKHIARTTFTLDGGPANWGATGPDPPYVHSVTPGVDYEFPNNYAIPYEP